MKRKMRHTYEIHAILTAIYCINETTIHDEDIKKLIDYAFYRIYKESTYDLKQNCEEKTKDAIMNDLIMLLKSETNF